MTNTTLQQYQDARAEVLADIRVPARAIVDRIHAAMEAGLYPDGLTTDLKGALGVNQLLAGPPEPVEPEGD